MTRREDPNWGTAVVAQRANDDTYHHTNACPQVNNGFNASQKFWQGIENFVLNSADDSNLRVTVITGPVLAEDDPVYEDDEFGPLRLPRRFWKVVARVEDGTPKVFAVLADQSAVMDAAWRASEAAAPFQWPARLSREFRSSVKDVAALTGLDFGDLANHDVFADGSESREPITSPEDLIPPGAPIGGFGAFRSIGAFLEAWEHSLRRAPSEAQDQDGESPGAEAAGPPVPAVRLRNVVELRAVVSRVLADDLSGAKHQCFAIVVTQLIDADDRARADVQMCLEARVEVRVAVRFGDGRGLADRVPGVRSDVPMHLKGEWIGPSDASAVGGERVPVLHFMHDPLGFVCTPLKCFS